MNSIYTDNKEICLFINRAQNKIADLAGLIVDRGGDLPESIQLVLELASFLECLDSVYCTWTIDQVLTWIHEYNYRANLNELAYLNIYGFTTNIEDCGCDSGDGSGISLPIKTSDISDYILATNNLISKFPHNNLSGLQGGNVDERYHVTKKMYDYLDSIVNPSTPNSVGLTINSPSYKWPSGYYELGTSIGVVNLIGSIAYGKDTKAIYYEYTKNGQLLGTRNTNPLTGAQPNASIDNSFITTDVTYSFNASFSDGLKSSTKSIQFRQPMYYGIIKRFIINDGTVVLSEATKDVRDRGEMTLSFNIPVGNTELDYDQSSTPYLLIPKSWGKFITAINLMFDFSGDFSVKDYDMPLADGTTRPSLLITYDTQIEGLTTFKFNW